MTSSSYYNYISYYNYSNMIDGIDYTTRIENGSRDPIELNEH